MILGRPNGDIVMVPNPVGRMTPADRRATCAQCPSMRVRLGTMWCGEPIIGAVVHPPEGKTCGCSIELKALFPITECPQGKWHREVQHG